MPGGADPPPLGSHPYAPKCSQEDQFAPKLHGCDDGLTEAMDLHPLVRAAATVYLHPLVRAATFDALQVAFASQDGGG